jgi:lysophospholipase L1-like esterase
MRPRIPDARRCLLIVGVAGVLTGCGSGSTTSDSGSGGATSTGGTGGMSGGSATGGGRAAGGATASGGTGDGTGAAGNTGAAGTSATGGAGGLGGALGSGGTPSTGGSGAGAGGVAGVAGAKGAGGISATGGTTPSGGSRGQAGSSAIGGSTGAAGSTHAGIWNVMPLGDSVTEDTCYPQLTYSQLMAGNHKNFQFVGTETTNQSCGSSAPSSVKDEGHAGYGVTYLPQNSTRGACTKSSGCGSYTELQTWAAEKPDIVLMHFGTNDVWDGVATSTIMSAYVAVIAEFRKQNPNVIFFVSKIIKLDPSGCGSCLTNVAALAAALTPSWASTNSTSTSPIYLIDHYDSSFDPTNTADSSDGVHPTPAGAAIMATVTYDAVVASGYF